MVKTKGLGGKFPGLPGGSVDTPVSVWIYRGRHRPRKQGKEGRPGRYGKLSNVASTSPFRPGLTPWGPML
jgi:hypothetical protein